MLDDVVSTPITRASMVSVPLALDAASVSSAGGGTTVLCSPAMLTCLCLRFEKWKVVCTKSMIWMVWCCYYSQLRIRVEAKRVCVVFVLRVCYHWGCDHGIESRRHCCYQGVWVCAVACSARVRVSMGCKLRVWLRQAGACGGVNCLTHA